MGSSCRDQQTSGVLRKPINRQQQKKRRRLELRNQLDTIIHRQIIKPRKEIHKSQSKPRTTQPARYENKPAGIDRQIINYDRLSENN